MNNNTKTNWVFNSQEDNNDAQLYSNIEAQVLANIADEIYEDIKDLIENAESVSIKVGNNKPIGFKIDEFAKIAKSK